MREKDFRKKSEPKAPEIFFRCYNCRPRLQDRIRVVEFILDEIESVPHLEALLLIRSTCPKKWTVDALKGRLYLSREAVENLLADLSRRKLLTMDPAGPAYFYEPTSLEKENLISRVDQTYRHQLVRISQLIHSKPSAALRDFSRAFRFTKKDES